MSSKDVIRAWKDQDYRSSLSERRGAPIPENPAGPTGLSDEDLPGVAGGSIVIVSNCFTYCFPVCTGISVIVPNTLLAQCPPSPIIA